MSSLYQNRRFEQRSAKDTDQAEFSAIIRGSSVVDAGIFDDRIAGALDDFEPQSVADIESWHRQDLEIDSAVGRIQEEVERRARILGNAYPFKLKDNEIIYAPSAIKVYEFCLAVSCAPSLTKGEYVGLPRVFERSAALIVEGYLGQFAASLHTGWPRDAGVGNSFRQVMTKLNQLTGEWIWSTHPDLPADPPDDKDEGLDFVVWKEALDKRPGKIFVLGQCACGDDWDQKLNDLNVARLDKWFHPLSYVPPVRSFATPHFLSDGNLINAQREAGIVFDRPRLTLMADKCLKEDSATVLKPQLEKLVALVLRPVAG